MSAIIAAIIGAGGSALGAVLGIVVNTKLISYRLSQLESKVNKHNNLIERTYSLESHVGLLEERIKVANHRIDDLENEQHGPVGDNKYFKEV